MKILLATIDYWPAYGGVANYYGNIASHWPEAGQLQVLDNSQKALVDETRSFIKWWPAIKTLRRKLKDKEFDHLLVGQILPLGTVAIWLKKFYKFEYSVVLHGMDFDFALRVPRKRKLALKILNGAAKIICSNSYLAGEVSKFVGQEAAQKVFVVNPGIEPASMLPRNEQRIAELKKQYELDGKFVILTLARLVKRKGVDQVILALSRLHEKWPDLAYVVAGAGPDEEYLKNYAQAAGNYFAEHIRFIGAPSDDDKWQWFHLCDCFAMPARNDDGDYEGFGIVYLEANLCGKPVIAGQSGGVGDAVVDGENGFLVGPTDTAAISQALMTLMDNPEVGKKLGEQGRARAAAKFLWQDLTLKFYKVINSIAN
jgi:phosphatidylinositol alpha-1,6-mannosyltransferase